MLKQSFAPFVDTRARILILGTLPGEQSLRLQRYYGNPRNLFWRVLADVFAEPHVVEYEQQKALLKRNRIALWDVLHSAERIGSLDSAIRNPVPNDIAKLLVDYPRLRTIAFNGLRAQSLFRQFIAATLTIPARQATSVCPALDEPDAEPQGCQLRGESRTLGGSPESRRPHRT